MCASRSLDPPVKPRSGSGAARGYLIGLLILLGFAGFVQWYLGWAALLRPWTRLSPPALVTAAALMLLSYGVRAVRLFDYFRPRMTGRFPAALRLTLQHNLWNNLLPMRAGEASFPLLMARYFEVPPRESLPALLWFRVLDLHTLVAGALAALGGVWLSAAPTAAVTVAWMVLPWTGYRLGRRLAPAEALDPPAAGRASQLLRRVMAGLPASPRAFWRAWAWTLINWTVKFIALAWILRQFVDLPAAAAVLGVVAGDATSVLPVHGVAGAGTYEAGILAGLAAAGARPAPAAALAGAVDLHLFILGAALIGGVAAGCLPGRRRRE